jgi:dihydroorotate dehydrogenase electron transfer subunit
MDREPRDETAVVRENGPVAPGYWRMRLAVPPREYAPGRFFQLRVRAGAWSPLLRRAFAPSELHHDGLAFVYGVVGEGTRLMTGLGPGSAVQVLGPLGRGWRLPEGGTALLVGGGAGAPGLSRLAAALAERGVRAYLIAAARTAAGGLMASALAHSPVPHTLATDDGSEGFRGHALAAAARALARWEGPPPAVFGCGPDLMLRALAAWTRENKLACQVSLEGRMACGFGACMGCAVAVKAEDGRRYVRACTEGPVFDAAEVDWTT